MHFKVRSKFLPTQFHTSHTSSGLGFLATLKSTGLLSSFFSFLLLLTLQAIHVALEKVAVGKLELIHFFRVNHRGNFLILENCPDEAHVFRGLWVRLCGWWNFGIHFLSFLFNWSW